MFKYWVKNIITSFELFLRTVGRPANDFPRVFVYHRFSSGGGNVSHRVSVNAFGWQLDEIVKHYQVLTLGEGLQYHRENNRWPSHCAILTIDDGYRDFYELAYPELRKRGLKATFFTTVNFVDQKIWLWPDRLQFAMENTREKALKIFLSGKEHHFQLRDESQKLHTLNVLMTNCKEIANDERLSLLGAVEVALGVDLPECPTSEYAAVTWAELIEMQRNGIEVGCHTMNHPILSRISCDQLLDEIGVSKTILEEKLNTSILSFCYPNSGPGDINDAVVNTVRELGYWGAAFGRDLGRWEPFKVPRMGVTNDKTDFLWKLNGGESLLSSIKNKFP